VSSKKPESGASLEARFLASVNRFTDANNPTLLIALSGGVDSVVLLTLAAKLRAEGNIAVRAIYVDHGLQQQSDEWGRHSASLCNAVDVDFKSLKVTVDLESGLSPEAAARDARYLALQQELGSGEFLCTAHHADDQAETLMLQLFRGAGVQGLASMPACREFGSGYLLRPLLDATKTEILHYAKQHALSWREDPSNADTSYDRNYLRNEFLPALKQRWPKVTANISRSAAHCADAMELASELAELDLAGSAVSSPLTVTLLNSLPEIRKKNLLRYWITENGYRAPSTIQLQQIFNDLVESDNGSHGYVSFGDAQVARYQDELFIGDRGSFEPLPDFEYQWQDSSDPLLIEELNWRLDASARSNLKDYQGQSLIVRNRRGGERWRPDPDAQSLSVKSLLQQRRIPPWQRSRLVFVFSGDTLIEICAREFDL